MEHTENAPIEEILQLLRKQSSILSSPEILIPIEYMEHIQDIVFERNRRLYVENEMLESEIIQYFRTILPNLKECFTICDYLIEKLNFDQLLDIFKRYAKRKNSKHLYMEIHDLEKELHQYMVAQERKLLIEKRIESE